MWAHDRFDEGSWFVLQHRPYKFNVLELLELDTYDDGRNVEISSKQTNYHLVKIVVINYKLQHLYIYGLFTLLNFVLFV